MFLRIFVVCDVTADLLPTAVWSKFSRDVNFADGYILHDPQKLQKFNSVKVKAYTVLLVACTGCHYTYVGFTVQCGSAPYKYNHT